MFDLYVLVLHRRKTLLRDKKLLLEVYLVSVLFLFFLTHFVPQMRLSCFERDVASACKRETLVLDQYFHFCVPSVEVTAPS